MFSKLTLNLLNSEATSHSYSRGEDYYKRDVVRNITYDPTEDFIQASVRGRRPYTVIISNVSATPVFSCTCPVGESLCKHVVATALKIIHEPGAVKTLIKLESPNKSNNLQNLLDKATREEKDDFLYDVLIENDSLLQRFETMIMGQLSVESSTTVEDIRNTVKEDLESIDLSDYDQFYHHDHESYGFYRDEWDIMHDNAVDEFEEIVRTYTSRSLRQLGNRNIIEASKILVGLFQGILSADEEALNDDMGVLQDGFEGMLIHSFLTFQDDFVEAFQAADKQDGALMRICQLVAGQIDFFRELADHRHAHAGEYINIIQPFIRQLISIPDIAAFWSDLLNRHHLVVPETDEIQLQIASVSGNPGAWLQIAEKHFKTNRKITKQLLDVYLEQKNTVDFIHVAQFALETWANDFDQYICQNLHQHLTPAASPDLYADALSKYAKRTESLELFDQLVKECGTKKAADFIDDIKSGYGHKVFYVTLLEHLQDYPAILDFVKTNVHDWEFIDYITPILNIYTLECFDIIRSKTDTFLEINIGRKYYHEAAQWLKLLHKINDEEIKKKSHLYIHSLVTTYNRRPALKDELKKAGLY